MCANAASLLFKLLTGGLKLDHCFLMEWTFHPVFSCQWRENGTQWGGNMSQSKHVVIWITVLNLLRIQYNPIENHSFFWVGKKKNKNGGWLFCTGHENTRSTQHLLTRSLELGWILIKYAPWFNKKICMRKEWRPIKRTHSWLCDYPWACAVGHHARLPIGTNQIKSINQSTGL